jgi:hypothetical protein
MFFFLCVAVSAVRPSGGEGGARVEGERERPAGLVVPPPPHPPRAPVAHLPALVLLRQHAILHPPPPRRQGRRRLPPGRRRVGLVSIVLLVLFPCQLHALNQRLNSPRAIYGC